MKKLAPILERLLLTLIFAAILTPLTLTALSHYFPKMFRHAPWIANQTLTGIAADQSAPLFSWAALGSGEYQKAVGETFDGGFASRELLIRLTCEAWYRLFRASPLTSASIMVGRDDNLFEASYLDEYCLTRNPRENLVPLIKDIRRLQDACDRIGLGFVFMVTPSKAAIFPDKLPPGWLKRFDPRPRSYEYFMQSLAENGIRHVDGHALTLEAIAESPVPVFPRGGIHWGPYPAWKTNSAVVASLKAQGLPVDPLEIQPPTITDQPEGEEADLMNLMNMAVPWRYPNSLVSFVPDRRPKSKLNLVIVGGSFTNKTAIQLAASEQFSCVQYFYYKKGKLLYTGTTHHIVRAPVEQLDFDAEIFSADALLLEINESVMNGNGLSALTQFVGDALKHLDEKGPLNRRPFAACEWDQEISFNVASTPFIKNAFSLGGFSGFEGPYVWTDGPVATVRLSIPKTSRDLVLQANVGGYFDTRQFPSQTLKVFANDKPAGEWNMSTFEPTTQSIHIPHSLVGDSGNLILRFEIAHPVSPLSLGQGGDPRMLGARFYWMKVTQAQ